MLNFLILVKAPLNYSSLNNHQLNFRFFISLQYRLLSISTNSSLGNVKIAFKYICKNVDIYFDLRYLLLGIRSNLQKAGLCGNTYSTRIWKPLLIDIKVKFYYIAYTVEKLLPNSLAAKKIRSVSQFIKRFLLQIDLMEGFFPTDEFFDRISSIHFVSGRMLLVIKDIYEIESLPEVCSYGIKHYVPPVFKYYKYNFMLNDRTSLVKLNLVLSYRFLCYRIKKCKLSIADLNNVLIDIKNGFGNSSLNSVRRVGESRKVVINSVLCRLSNIELQLNNSKISSKHYIISDFFPYQRRYDNYTQFLKKRLKIISQGLTSIYVLKNHFKFLLDNIRCLLLKDRKFITALLAEHVPHIKKAIKQISKVCYKTIFERHVV